MVFRGWHRSPLRVVGAQDLTIPSLATRGAENWPRPPTNQPGGGVETASRQFSHETVAHDANLKGADVGPGPVSARFRAHHISQTYNKQVQITPRRGLF